MGVDEPRQQHMVRGSEPLGPLGLREVSQIGVCAHGQNDPVALQDGTIFKAIELVAVEDAPNDIFCSNQTGWHELVSLLHPHTLHHRMRQERAG